MLSARLFAAVAIAVTATACGGGGGKTDGGGLVNDGGVGTAGVASCTLSESLGGTTLKLCEEVSGPADAVQAVQQGCTAQGIPDAGVQVQADFRNGPCSHTGALGGCRVAQGPAVATIWYYDDGSGLQTPADIQMLCTSAGAQYIAP